MTQIITLDEWIQKAREHVDTFPEGLKKFYAGLLIDGNKDSWKDYYEDDYTPEDAIAEDMTYLD
jgi:hypothetical protein